MTGVDWGRLLDGLDVDAPAVGQVAEAYADATDTSISRAYERVETALDAGELVEEDTGGAFPGVTVASEGSDEIPEPEGGLAGSNSTLDPSRSPSSTAKTFADTDFTAIDSDTYPPELLDREQWMGRRGKLPFAPWADRTHPEAAEDKDARYKWGLSENYVDGETVALAEDDPRLDGRVFIQLESDPFAFVDGDDVRCPETGEVHPEFVRLLEALGFTYADVSTSGTGVHAYYRGELPNGMSQAVFDIDPEPWGANDTPPTVEIYAGKHVNVATGDHVTGTPLDVTKWDAAALRTVLEECDALRDEREIDHVTDRDREDLAEYEPTATAVDETTKEIRDVLKAVDRLRPSDLPLRAGKVGEDATGWEQWDPSSYRTSSGNDSLHRPAGEAVFYDHKHGEAFGVLSLFAAEEGILSKPWDRLAGAEWWTAVDTAREAGAPIPEYVGTREGDAEHVAVLPAAVRDLTAATSEWDWRHAGTIRDGLSLDEAHDRTQAAIANAYQSRDQVLIEALPTMGKTTGAIWAAADTGARITYLCPRREVMEEVGEMARDASLDVYTLPAFTRHCDTANGEHGDEWADTVRDWYDRGATPRDIHKNAENELGRPLPCQKHEGRECPYTSRWRFGPDDYDILIGHYVHGHKPKVTQGRTVVFDEFPGGAYETTLGYTLEASVTAFLEAHDALPFEDYADLMEHRTDPQRRADALLWFEENEPEDDSLLVFDSSYAHAKAPYAVFTILAAATENLGNGWERCNLPDGGYGLFDRENNVVHLLKPPGLTYTSGVVALDGTPTKRMWELTLGTRLNHRQVLTDDEREEYIRDVLNLNLVRTSEYMKPYNNPDYVHVAEDRALLEGIRAQHGQKPVLITTLAAESVYEDEGVLDEVAQCEHYGNLKSSNEFATERLGVVVGSQHYGDGFIEKWGAYAGKAIERGEGKGVDLSYGPFGDRILSHMREHETLQAAMRFGRDGNGATVYVNTAALPDWMPIAGEGRVLKVWSDGMRQVLDAANGLSSWRTADIVNHLDVTIGERQVRDHLNTLAERGYLSREVEGRGYVWRDDGLHRVNDYGEVEIDVVEDDDTLAEVSRMSTYTWDFRNSFPTSVDSPNAGGSNAPPVTHISLQHRFTATNGGDQLPDDRS